MSQKFTEGFKIQAVEKALNRSLEITLVGMAKTLGVIFYRKEKPGYFKFLRLKI